MGALATSKSTHISVVVPMTGYILCSVFAYYVTIEEWRHRRNSEMLPSLERPSLERGPADDTAGETKLDEDEDVKQRDSLDSTRK
jgi:hypothetical protein